MKHEVRFGWIGGSRRSALRVLLADIVDEWAREWWLAYAAGGVEVVEATSASQYGEQGRSLLASGEEGVVAVNLGGVSLMSVGQGLAATMSDEDSELARRIGEDGLSDLADRIQRRAGCNKPLRLVAGVAPLSVEYARLGAFALNVSAGPLLLRVVIDRRIADRLVPPSGGQSTPLLSRRDALEHALLGVLAVMEFGSMDLAHLSDLCVGEVLVGDHKLEDTLHVHVEGYGVVAAGYLRRSGEQRAIMLDGASTQDKPIP